MNNNIENQFNFNILFKEDSEGRIIFYPSGGLGNAYWVPDPSLENEIKKFLVLHSGITGALLSLGVLIYLENSRWFSLFIFLPIPFLWYRIKMAKLLKGLEIININSAHYSPPTIDKHHRRFLVVILILGLIAGIGDIYNKGCSINDFLLVVCSVTFLVLFGYMNWIRK